MSWHRELVTSQACSIIHLWLLWICFLLWASVVRSSKTVAGCHQPSLDFRPQIVTFYWPTITNRFPSQNPFLLWQSPKPYFSCQFMSRPAVHQLAFLNHCPQPESHRALSAEQIQPGKVTLFSFCQNSDEPYAHKVLDAWQSYKTLHERKKTSRLSC